MATSERCPGCGFFDQALEQTMIANQKLLDRLRQTGVAALIEKAALNSIQDVAYTGRDGNQHGRMHMYSPERNEWWVYVLPTNNPDKTYDITRLNLHGFKSFDWRKHTQYEWSNKTATLEIVFTENDNLTVSGDQVTFSGSIKNPNQDLLKEVQTGIAAAFRKPNIRPGRSRICSL